MLFTFQIDDNGNLNFEGKSFSSDRLPSTDGDIIAVLWDDLDPEKPPGQIFYRQTMDSTILSVSFKSHNSACLTEICLTGVN